MQYFTSYRIIIASLHITPRTMSMYPKKPSRFGTHIPILGLNFEATSRPDDKMKNKDEDM